MTSAVPHARLEFGPGLAFLIGVHLALDVILPQVSLFWEEHLVALAITVPLSQLSLVVIWAAVVLRNRILTLAVPMLGMFLCWIVLSKLLPWGTSEAVSAGWALVLLFQTATVFAAIGCSRRLLSPAIGKLRQGSEGANPNRFEIRDLMLWTAVVAVGLGFMRWGIEYWGWNENLFHWELLFAVPVLGITQGLVAALWLRVFVKRAPVYWNLLAAVLLSAGLAVSQYFLSMWVVGPAVIELQQSLTLVAGQSCLIAASLAVARACYVQPMSHVGVIESGTA